MEISPDKSKTFTLNIRIPGWASGQIIPGDLYTADQPATSINIYVNGRPIKYPVIKGYAQISRSWKKGDKVSFELPMQVQRVLSNARVGANKGRFAFQYGPLVYCIEGADNKDSMVQNIFIEKQAPVQVNYIPNKLNGIIELSMQGYGSKRLLHSDELIAVSQAVKAIPYYAWNNRGAGEMMVWIPFTKAASRPQPANTIAYLSKADGSTVNRGLRAINDQFEPVRSADNTIPIFTGGQRRIPPNGSAIPSTKNNW